MSEYRICEECEYKNNVSASQCFSCGADLSFVMISEEEEIFPNRDEEGNVAGTGGTTPPGPGRVKICDVCKHANDIGFMECVNCDNDISYIRPSPLNETRPDRTDPLPSASDPAPDTTSESSQAGRERATTLMEVLVFNGVQDGHKITIPAIGGILGREGIGAEYLDRSNFVSREHVHLEYAGDRWIMTVLGTNPTLVNGRVVPRGNQSPLEHGDMVRLADLDFKIELK